MTDVYLSPISRLIEIGLAISGILILVFAARVFSSADAWGDGAEYEMMGLTKPAADNGQTERARARAGVIGPEDRVVRIGFAIACTYLAMAWFGIGSLAMWLLTVPVLYFLLTATIGIDPLYRRLRLTTRVD